MDRKESNAKYYASKKAKLVNNQENSVIQDLNETILNLKHEKEIILLKSKIELLEQTIKHKDEIILLLQSPSVSMPPKSTPKPTPKPELPPKPTELPPKPTELPPESRDKSNDNIFEKCMCMEGKCVNKDDYLKHSINKDDPSFQEIEINNFITSRIHTMEWSMEEQFKLYKLDILGNRSYQEMIEYAKNEAEKIFKSKKYEDEELDTIVKLNSKLDRKIEKSDIPSYFNPYVYVSIKLSDIITERNLLDIED